ncbi:hypothetical protein [Cupriavidus basilensis]|uniref:DUF7673 domain-containing protein n=1 Tax=Cupriavidus basilensis TaxID=68895 RepID=A0A7M2HC38_9BURK|nr:hypothetical protein [Cupriavidus basilensis]QOT82185.1 hypothetical protein F7R26_038570 [Cupriavidus basilensis]
MVQRVYKRARRVADFLLAWWNAGECSGFDLTNLWQLDDELVYAIQCAYPAGRPTRQALR